MQWLVDNWSLVAVVAGFILLLLFIRARHERLGELDERCTAAFADIDVLLIERHALIPQLVETVRGMTKHESNVLVEVTQARALALASAGTVRLEAEQQVGQCLMSLLNVVENYPEVAASSHFHHLRTEIVRIEDKLAAARRFYNLTVEEMNATRRSFPDNMIAAVTRIEPRACFALTGPREAYDRPAEIRF